jgi:hypothetical protein
MLKACYSGGLKDHENDIAAQATALIFMRFVHNWKY